MRPRWGFALVLGTVLAWPTPASAQSSFSDFIDDILFQELVLTIGPDAAHLEARRQAIDGDGARTLRTCIDSEEDCPNDLLGRFSQGDGDGEVDATEVRGFAAALEIILNGVSDDETIDGLRDRARDLVKIDSTRGGRPTFTLVQFDQATGPADSDATIFLTVRLESKYEFVDQSGSHKVSVTRQATDLEIARRVTVQTVDGWNIEEASIRPSGMRDLYSDGRITGTQSEFESDQPLAFEIKSKGGMSWLPWLIGGLALAALMAGGLGTILWMRGRKG